MDHNDPGGRSFTMRMNTYLESQGTEFLVLGMLLARGIEAYKTYANMKGYDLLAIGNGNGKSLKIQVKSRARIGATDFPAKNLGDCDIVCVVVLNKTDNIQEVLSPNTT
jgi:hypothetical protein